MPPPTRRPLSTLSPNTSPHNSPIHKKQTRHLKTPARTTLLFTAATNHSSIATPAKKTPAKTTASQKAISKREKEQIQQYSPYQQQQQQQQGNQQNKNSPYRQSPFRQSPFRLLKLNATPTTKGMDMEDVGKNYAEWMKFATDNKLTAVNAWNFALIDYFHELALLKEGDSINFQKASVTLDGCVKIYTTRVDSVNDDTKQLVTGLSGSRKNDNEEDQADVDVTQNTINFKTLDMEYAVDPLFKKTCADFDEGGSKGLLMNHLEISRNGAMVFDAGEVEASDRLEVDPDEMIEADETIQNLLKFTDSLESLDLCPSLAAFDFSWDTKDIPLMDLALFDAPEMIMQEAEEAFQEAFAEPMNYEPIMMDQFDDNASQPEQEDFPEYAPFNPENIRARTAPEYQAIARQIAKGSNHFSHFDPSMVKDWSGVDKWRLRPLFKEPSSTGTVKKKRVKKPVIDIEFFEDASERLAEILAKEKRTATGLLLPKKDRAVAARENVMIEGAAQFTPKYFYQLMTRPSRLIKPSDPVMQRIIEGGAATGERVEWVSTGEETVHRVNNVDVPEPPIEDDDQVPLDAMFESTNMLSDDPTVLPPDGGNMEEDSSGLPPFASDGQDDARSDFGVFDLSQDVGMEVEFKDQLISAPKNTKSLFVNYTRTAKRVDVKHLKDDIWGALNREDHLVNDSVQFTSMVNCVSSQFSTQKRLDITPSFYFICLLHLANEKNLTIENAGSNFEELSVTQNRQQEV